MHPPTHHRKCSRYSNIGLSILPAPKRFLRVSEGYRNPTVEANWLSKPTRAGDATTQRMLIDDNGNVGIGTGNPGARLDVAGDAKFSGPLSVQGALTVDGVTQIGGDLSVTGSLSIAGTNLRLTKADSARAVEITGEGAMISPMWTVTQVYLNEQAAATPFPRPRPDYLSAEAIHNRRWHLADSCLRFGSRTLRSSGAHNYWNGFVAGRSSRR